MDLRFPLLSGHDIPHLPRDGTCLLCSQPIKDGVAYITAGSVPDKDGDPEPLAIWYLGYHSASPDCEGCAHVDVVEDLKGGQFDLSFCSTGCLRRFLNYIVDVLERQLEMPTEHIDDEH